MSSCVICKCYSRGGSIYKVPKCEKRRRSWSDSCGIEFPYPSSVCASHFAPQDFVNTPGACKRSRLHPAVPRMPSLPVIANETDANTLPHKAIVTKIEKIRVNRSVQTHDIAALYAMENASFKNQLTEAQNKLEQAKSELSAKEAELKAIDESLSQRFTDGQKRKLRTPNVPIHWNWDDISEAIRLHAASARAYKHLYDREFPLPSTSTLGRFLQKIQITEGIQQFSLDSMKNMLGMRADEKICVLSFDEMKVASVYEVDEPMDVVMQPKNYVQVAMVRGLKSSWKQPIFYGFDCRMTRELLSRIIQQLYEIEFPVVAIVSDLGPTNQKLWSQLQLTTEKTWFPNPASPSEKIFVFADVPHLLKLIRNRFIDSGLLYRGQLVVPQSIHQLISLTAKSDMSISHKISEDHLNVRRGDRQKVKLAGQLFSHTTASALRRCSSLGLNVLNAELTAEFIDLVNDWFDLMNSKMCNMMTPKKMPFGKDLQNQLQVLDRMSNLMAKSIVPNKNLSPFQKGILVSNQSLRGLYQYLSDKYGMEFILTYRLNQDVLEHFFSAIRSRGGMNDHPTPMNFKHRFRKYMLARNTELLSHTGSVEPDTTEWLKVAMPTCRVQTSEKREVDNYGVALCMEDSLETLHEDALEYVAGYIIRRLKLSSSTDEITGSWVGEVSLGRLTKPSAAFLKEIKLLELVFMQHNDDKISLSPHLKNTLLELSKEVDLPNAVRSFFFKCRIHFRVKSLNKRLNVQRIKQRIVGNNKLLKIMM